MLTYFRYALAAVCFAASVGCLALWGWTKTQPVISFVSYYTLQGMWQVQFLDGVAHGRIVEEGAIFANLRGWHYASGDAELPLVQLQAAGPLFGASEYGYFCPLWYPALIFALAGVAVLRFRRQFSIRSALVAVSVVAALLGMAVVL